MAQTAATIDELSGGRLTLGLGVSHRPVVEGWHGQTIDRPVAEMREYVAIVRAILRGEDPPAGEKWRPAFISRARPATAAADLHRRALARDAPPRRRDRRRRAAVAVQPQLHSRRGDPRGERGRERAGHRWRASTWSPAVPGALTDDREAAYRAMRRDLIPYFGLPFYRAMIDRTGFAADVAAYDAARATWRRCRPRSPRASSSELTAVGDREAGVAGVERYRAAGASSPCIGPIARTDIETTLRAGIGA